MRILLQDSNSGLYLKDLGHWTPLWEEAYCFSHIASAVDFWLQNQIIDVHIVLKFQKDQYDIHLRNAGSLKSSAAQPAGPAVS